MRTEISAVMDLQAWIGPLRGDNHSGAADLARRAAQAFEAAIEQTTAQDVDALRAELAWVAKNVLEAQPAIAPLVTLASAVLRASSGTASRETARLEVRRAVRTFRDHLDRGSKEVAARAEGLIPAGGRVLTVSASTTVLAALLEAAKRRSFDVICLEGRPQCEGRDVAGRLAEAGVRVTVAVDAAVAAVIRGCDVVVMGADAVGDLGVVNKIGSRIAALAARGAGIPVYALTDTSKFLPVGFPQPLEDERPTDEVWPDAPSGVTIWNRYFEATPLCLFEGLVTEFGLRDESEVEKLRGRLECPAELRAVTVRK